MVAIQFCLVCDSGESLYTNIGAGILSGAIGSSLANPTDVLKVTIL